MSDFVRKEVSKRVTATQADQTAKLESLQAQRATLQQQLDAADKALVSATTTLNSLTEQHTASESSSTIGCSPEENALKERQNRLAALEAQLKAAKAKDSELDAALNEKEAAIAANSATPKSPQNTRQLRNVTSVLERSKAQLALLEKDLASRSSDPQDIAQDLVNEQSNEVAALKSSLEGQSFSQGEKQAALSDLLSSLGTLVKHIAPNPQLGAVMASVAHALFNATSSSPAPRPLSMEALQEAVKASSPDLNLELIPSATDELCKMGFASLDGNTLTFAQSV